MPILSSPSTVAITGGSFTDIAGDVYLSGGFCSVELLGFTLLTSICAVEVPSLGRTRERNDDHYHDRPQVWPNLSFPYLTSVLVIIRSSLTFMRSLPSAFLISFSEKLYLLGSKTSHLAIPPRDWSSYCLEWAVGGRPNSPSNIAGSGRTREIFEQSFG